MSETADPQKRVREELAVAITEARGGKQAGEFADHLLDNEKARSHLVGLINGGERGVLFEQALYNLVAVRYGADKPGLSRYRLTKVEIHEAVDDYVHEQGEEFWTWLHPRYRWVFEE